MIENMIEKSVSVRVLERTATVAQVHAFACDVYVFDLLDGVELLALNRYATPADAPFVLTPEELAELTAPPVEIVV